MPSLASPDSLEAKVSGYELCFAARRLVLGPDVSTPLLSVLMGRGLVAQPQCQVTWDVDVQLCRTILHECDSEHRVLDKPRFWAGEISTRDKVFCLTYG